MYIRIKIFDKKLNGDFNKPFSFIEVEGKHAIELSIINMLNQFFGKTKSEKVKNKIEEIKDILMEEN